VTFRVRVQTVGWITMALKTITPEHRDLRRVSIYLPQLTFFNFDADVMRFFGWLDLDHILVEFWESRSIRPRVGFATQGGGTRSVERSAGPWLPEITKRGIVDPA